jgi:hypothetical protein
MTDLFSYEPKAPNYRPSDPITSRDAGRSAHDFSAAHHQAILNILRRAERAMAPEEIADALDWAYARGKSSVVLDKVQICKRCAELLEGDAIERTTEQHLNRSGRKAFRIRLKQSQSLPAAIPSGSQP